MAGLEIKCVPHLGKYLGTHINSSYGRKAIFQETLQKITPRLQGWQAKLLSQAGRTNLCKHVVQCLPVCPFPLEVFPKMYARH